MNTNAVTVDSRYLDLAAAAEAAHDFHALTRSYLDGLLARATEEEGRLVLRLEPSDRDAIVRGIEWTHECLKTARTLCPRWE